MIKIRKRSDRLDQSVKIIGSLRTATVDDVHSFECDVYFESHYTTEELLNFAMIRP